MDPYIILSSVLAFVFTSGLRILLIVFAFYAGNSVLRRFIKKVIGRLVVKGARKKERRETLVRVFSGTARFVLLIVASLMILSEIGMDIMPLLAGAGLLGLAVSMGSREIVADFLSGFFIILESQFYVGDKVKIGAVEGEVVDMTLRRTTIKDKDGATHAIPNGQIKAVTKL